MAICMPSPEEGGRGKDDPDPTILKKPIYSETALPSGIAFSGSI